MKKYNKITKEQILYLFEDKDIITRKDITTAYNCSVYSVIQAIDELKDDRVIKLTNRGYVEI